MAVNVVVFRSENGASALRANRVLQKTLGELSATICQFVNIWSFDHFIAKCSNTVIPQLVGHEKHDIWLFYILSIQIAHVDAAETNIILKNWFFDLISCRSYPLIYF